MVGTRSFRGGWPVALLFAAVLVLVHVPAKADVESWKISFPKTDFTRHTVPLDEILSGGVGRDGIPPIDAPRFAVPDEIEGLSATEPVISLVIGGEAKAYPLRVMTFHEIVNDTLGGVPVSVTYCPLCNSAIVFDRRLDGAVLDFGVSGNLRNSDLVMYDRQTESWWQQFTGTGIVGTYAGRALKMWPARVESYGRFTARHPKGKVLIPGGDVVRPYGVNPYRGYDRRDAPYFPVANLPTDIAPMAYVLVVGKEAWSLDLLRKEKRIEMGDLVITWESGQNSALDSHAIPEGRDIGNLVVQRRGKAGLGDVVHDLTFAFVFRAFNPGGKIHQ